jgi:hypothetical protein
VQRPQDVTSVVIGGEPGEQMAIDFVRNGKRATVAVKLAPLPTQQATPYSTPSDSAASRVGTRAVQAALV